MRKVYHVLCFCLLVLAHTQVSAQCSNGRYYNKIFSADNHLNVPYGSAPRYEGTIQNLTMDIFEPHNDNFAQRPLIILAFGGSFTSGVKESPDMLQLCNDFAQRGYVTATIDYRIGTENGDDSCIYKAVIRGIQDMNAAIRFFYKDRYTTNTYRIDTNQIFIGGTSAGAFIGLNKAYAKFGTFSRPIPSYFPLLLIDMGGPEGNSGNRGYSTKIKGVIDLCGAVMDSIWIQPGDPPLVGVHGTADNTVSYYYDSVSGAADIKKRFFGGGDIINRCNHIGFDYSLYSFYGADHVPFVLPIPLVPPASKYMDTTIRVVRDFLYTHVVCDSTVYSGIDEVVNPVSVSLLPNPSEDVINIYSHESKDLQVEVLSIDGRLISEGELYAHESYPIYKSELGAGIYLVDIIDKTKNRKLKTERIVFY